MRLKDRVAIVTGAARGIGQAYGLALAREGAKVVAADILSCAETIAKVQDVGGEALGKFGRRHSDPLWPTTWPLGRQWNELGTSLVFAWPTWATTGRCGIRLCCVSSCIGGRELGYLFLMEVVHGAFGSLGIT